jgi:hypothetical protein
MSWSGLASNQMVTFTDAQTSPFTLNAGQFPVTSNECMTKSQALTKYNLDASAMSAYANNQLVPKSVWVSGVTAYSYEVRLGSSNAEACSAFTEIVYSDSSTFTIGMILYTTSDLTTVVTGYTRVVNEAFEPYILDSTLGIVGAQIGSC